jgi:hypothetical protein
MIVSVPACQIMSLLDRVKIDPDLVWSQPESALTVLYTNQPILRLLGLRTLQPPPIPLSLLSRCVWPDCVGAEPRRLFMQPRILNFQPRPCCVRPRHAPLQGLHREAQQSTAPQHQRQHYEHYVGQVPVHYPESAHQQGGYSEMNPVWQGGIMSESC